MTMSRRRLINSASAALLLSDAAPTSEDRAARASQTWLSRHAEHERLGKRWQQIETRLFRDHNWPKLTRTQRKRFPEKHEMDDLYDRMDALHEENRVLLASLPELMANGGSCIAAPDGSWVAEPVVDKERIIIATLDHRRVREERQNFDPAGHYGRPDVTRLVVNRERQRTVEFEDS